jgi:hypothetical protein
VLAKCGGDLSCAATNAAMSADRMADGGRDLDLGVFVPSREVTGEQRLSMSCEQLSGEGRLGWFADQD